MKPFIVRVVLGHAFVVALAGLAAVPAAAAPVKPGGAGRARDQGKRPVRAKTPPPRLTPPSTRPAPAPRFGFERRTGETDKALTELLGRAAPAAPNDETAAAALTNQARAKQTLRANAKATVATLVGELQALRPNDVEAYAELSSLLAVVADDDGAIAAWTRTLMTDMPHPAWPKSDHKKVTTPDQPTGQPPAGKPIERDDPQVLIRSLASTHLYRAAKGGSGRAQAALLETAASPNLDARISAVKFTYALSRQRWKARGELEKRLPPTDTYLLYRF